MKDKRLLKDDEIRFWAGAVEGDIVLSDLTMTLMRAILTAQLAKVDQLAQEGVLIIKGTEHIEEFDKTDQLASKPSKEKIDKLLRSEFVTIGIDINCARTGQMWAFGSERLASRILSLFPTPSGIPDREKIARIICCFAQENKNCDECKHNTAAFPFPDCFVDIRENTDKLLSLFPNEEEVRKQERERIIRLVKSLITFGGNAQSGNYNQALLDVVQALKGGD